MGSDALAVFRLQVSAELDPGVIARVLERFTNLNILPRRVVAECGSHGTVHIAVDVAGVSEDMLTLIAAKLSQGTFIRHALWHRL